MTGGGRYPGEWENLARQARLARQQRMAQGWHSRGWQAPADLLRALDDQFADPSERRELAAGRQRARAAAAPCYDGDGDLAPLLSRYLDALGVRAPRHERGWPS